MLVQAGFDHVFQGGQVGIAHAAEACFLQGEVAEVFPAVLKDLCVDHGGSDGGIGFVGEFAGKVAAADGVDAGFERGDAEEPPFRFGDGLREGLFVVGYGLVFGEEAGYVLDIDFAVVGGEEDGAAGESGFYGVV